MNQKNFWTGASTKKLLKSEQGLLKLIGIQEYELDFAPLDGLHGNLKMHYLKIGKEGKTRMILIHGFGGGCLILFRILKTLSQYFQVYAIDLLGMGGSSRPKWVAKTPEEAEAFFVESLELFVLNVKWDKFILAGHSFGGFVSGQYAVTYPERVQHLLLLSPAGVGQLDEGETGLQKFEHRLSKSWKGRLALKTMKYCWKKNITPFSIARKFGRLSSFFFKGYINRRFKDDSLSKEEKKELGNYLYQVNMLKGSGQYGLTKAFKAGLWAHNPLKKLLIDKEFDKPVSFIYGVEDWMDPTDAYKVMKDFEERKIPCRVELVEDAGHHIYLDNPEGCLSAILQCLLGEEFLYTAQPIPPPFPEKIKEDFLDKDIAFSPEAIAETA